MNVLILTGAGVSSESGIPTFRGSDGLWEGHRVEEVATPEAYRQNPAFVNEFYNERRRRLLSSEIAPNAAHLAIANFEASHEGEFLLVTQNVDDLHQRAGSNKIVPMHGEILKARCVDSGELFDWREDLNEQTPHPRVPDRMGRLRPHLVWFGELPLELERIEAAAKQADLFLAIGTSGLVYPAAGIVRMTSPSCRTVEINLEETPVSETFDESIRGKASIEVPAFLGSL